MPSKSFLLTLPVELLHRILDFLDIHCIIFSFRAVCKTFHSITRNYHRLKLELSKQSKDYPFARLYRIISFENIGTLILRNRCLDRFSSLTKIRRFTRLRSIKLENINENDLRAILRHLRTLSTLKSLKILDQKIDQHETNVLLSAVIALPSLRHVHLDVTSQNIDDISWPMNSSFQELRLEKCSYKQWCSILHRSPNLRVACTTDFNLNDIRNIPISTPYLQLTSLILTDIRFPINHLETVLLAYPSLVYLYLRPKDKFAIGDLRRFSEWECFIREKLPQLKYFHFDLTVSARRSRDFTHIKSIIAAFRTPFWLEYTRWYAQFQYVRNKKGSLFTISSHVNEPEDLFPTYDKNIIQFSHFTRRNDDGLKMRTIVDAVFNLHGITEAIRFHQFTLPKNHLFDNITHLALYINKFIDWQQSNSLKLLSKLIDLSHLTEIWFLLSREQTLQADGINMILSKARKVRTFGVRNIGNLRGDIEKQCAAISHQIESFIIHSPDMAAMTSILEHVEQFNTITLKCDWSSPKDWRKMARSLHQQGKKFLVTEDYRSIQIWLKGDIDPWKNYQHELFILFYY